LPPQAFTIKIQRSAVQQFEGARDGKMPGLLHEGVLTMAIKKRVVDRTGNATTATVPTFSYSPNDSLAQMIVDAWVEKDFRDSLLERAADNTVTPAAALQAKMALAARGLYLERAVVITEDEHDNDYMMQDPNEVVFVLPNKDRVTPRPGQSLLDTARLLMSCTPNGI
jgi:hypothetical protein